MVRREPLGCAALTEARVERLDVLESFCVAAHLPLAPARAYDDHYRLQGGRLGSIEPGRNATRGALQHTCERPTSARGPS
jgi:hypothetical protein